MTITTATNYMDLS